MSAIVYSLPASQGRSCEPVVEHAVEAVGLVGEAVDGVLLVALAVAEAAEVAALAELGALVGHLPHHPLRDLVLAAQVLRPELPGLLGDVHHDGAGLEHADRRAAVLGLVVDHRGHAVIGVHAQEVFVELVALLDVDGRDLVFEAALLEQDGDLLAVGRGPVEDLDHEMLSLTGSLRLSDCGGAASSGAFNSRCRGANFAIEPKGHKPQCCHSRQAKRRAGIQPRSPRAEFGAGFPLARFALAGMTSVNLLRARSCRQPPSPRPTAASPPSGSTTSSPSASTGPRSSTASRPRCWSSWREAYTALERDEEAWVGLLYAARRTTSRPGWSSTRWRRVMRERGSVFPSAAVDPLSLRPPIRTKPLVVRRAGHLLHARHRADAGGRHRGRRRRLPLRPDRGQARHHAGGRRHRPHGGAGRLGQRPALPADRRRVRRRRGAAAGLRAGGGAGGPAEGARAGDRRAPSPSRRRSPCAPRWPRRASPSTTAPTPPSASSTPSRRG